MFYAFVLACAVDFHTKHRKYKTRKFDIEGFLPVASLNGVVGFPSLFIKSLIGSTRKI